VSRRAWRIAPPLPAGPPPRCAACWRPPPPAPAGTPSEGYRLAVGVTDLLIGTVKLLLASKQRLQSGPMPMTAHILVGHVATLCAHLWRHITKQSHCPDSGAERYSTFPSCRSRALPAICCSRSCRAFTASARLFAFSSCLRPSSCSGSDTAVLSCTTIEGASARAAS